MTTLFVTHPRFFDHVVAPGHPERPARLEAVLRGAARPELVDTLVRLEARPPGLGPIHRVHPPAHVERLEAISAAGGGSIDPDTGMGETSYEAALLAAGAGIVAVDALDRGDGDAAFLALRPPGHHARPEQAMGFCLLNNGAITARALADRGERVLIVDYDAHHGNGTQDVFYDDPAVAYVSMHEYPLYPGTGRIEEVGRAEGTGTTLNVPLPARATGDVYHRAIEDLVHPLAASFSPTWIIVSAGFDAHRSDPLTGLALSSGDFAALTTELLELAPPGRRLVFLEGGYDLLALEQSTAACLGAMAGLELAAEPRTSGGPGDDVVRAVRRHHDLLESPALGQ